MSEIDRLLERSRARIDPRVRAEDLEAEVQSGALVIDTRPEALRRRDGHLPDALAIERNVLEWRLDPTSPYRLPEIAGPDQRVIIVCDEGYASSLAAAVAADLGLTNVTDLDGGFQAWRHLHQPEPARRPGSR